VVRANLLAAEADVTMPLNIGRGEETSVRELVTLLSDLGDGQFDPEFAPERAGEVRRSCLDNARVRHELGWTPRVELREGLERAVAGLREPASG
jgi:UDP-glucose 4-epimerase